MEFQRQIFAPHGAQHDIQGVSKDDVHVWELSKKRREAWEREASRNQAESPRRGGRRTTASDKLRREMLLRSEEKARQRRLQIEEKKAEARRKSEARRHSWSSAAEKGRDAAVAYIQAKQQDERDLAELLSDGDDPLGLTKVYSSRSLKTTGLQRSLRISMSPLAAARHLALEDGKDQDTCSSGFR